MDVDKLYEEISGYLSETDVSIDGERLWTNYERVTGILIRLQAIRNDLSYLELNNQSTADLKKFRTTILDPTIDRFEKVAAYESRKITAKAVEIQLDKER